MTTRFYPNHTLHTLLQNRILVLDGAMGTLIQVRGLDDLSTGDPRALSPDVLFTRGDVNDRPKLWTLLQEVDCVYHLAARVIVAESVLYPREIVANDTTTVTAVVEYTAPHPFGGEWEVTGPTATLSLSPVWSSALVPECAKVS